MKLGINTAGLSGVELMLQINRYKLETRPELVKRLVMDEKIEFNEAEALRKIREKHGDWKESEVQIELERVRDEFQLVEPEKHFLVKKLSDLTGKSVSVLYSLSTGELQRMYNDVVFRTGTDPRIIEKTKMDIYKEWTGLTALEKQQYISDIRKEYPFVADLSDVDAYMRVRMREAEEVENELWIDKLLDLDQMIRTRLTKLQNRKKVLGDMIADLRKDTRDDRVRKDIVCT